LIIKSLIVLFISPFLAPSLKTQYNYYNRQGVGFTTNSFTVKVGYTTDNEFLLEKQTRKCDNFMNKKLDRRKKYTRQVLMDSLIALLRKKPITTITVKEIITDLTMYLNQYNFTEEEEEALQMTEKLLEYVVSKSEMFQTLLNENLDHSFERRVMDVARSFIIKSSVIENEPDAETAEYVI